MNKTPTTYRREDIQKLVAFATVGAEMGRQMGYIAVVFASGAAMSGFVLKDPTLFWSTSCFGFIGSTAIQHGNALEKVFNETSKASAKLILADMETHGHKGMRGAALTSVAYIPAAVPFMPHFSEAPLTMSGAILCCAGIALVYGREARKIRAATRRLTSISGPSK